MTDPQNAEPVEPTPAVVEEPAVIEPADVEPAPVTPVEPAEDEGEPISTDMLKEDLKAEAEARDLPTSGTKEELVERIEAHDAEAGAAVPEGEPEADAGAEAAREASEAEGVDLSAHNDPTAGVTEVTPATGESAEDEPPAEDRPAEELSMPTSAYGAPNSAA